MLNLIMLVNLTIAGFFSLVPGEDTYAIIGNFGNLTYLYDYEGKLIKVVDVYGAPSYYNGYYVITNATKVYLLKEDGTLINLTLPFSSRYSVMGDKGIVSCASYCVLMDANGNVIKVFLNGTGDKVVTSWNKYITVVDWFDDVVYVVDPSTFAVVKTINVTSPMWATNCNNYVAVAYRYPDRISIFDLDSGNNVTINNATATMLDFDDDCNYLASAEWYYMRGRVYSLNGSVAYEIAMKGDVEYVAWRGQHLAFSAAGSQLIMLRQAQLAPSLPWIPVIALLVPFLISRRGGARI